MPSNLHKYLVDIFVQDPRRLSVADLEDNDKSCRISPSSDYIPDGNCKRDLSSRAIKPTPNQSKPSTSNTAKETKVRVSLCCVSCLICRIF